MGEGAVKLPFLFQNGKQWPAEQGRKMLTTDGLGTPLDVAQKRGMGAGGSGKLLVAPDTSMLKKDKLKP